MMVVIPMIIGALRMVPKSLVREFGRVRNWRTCRDHPNYSIVEIGQNTEKSLSDLRRLAVTQTPVKDHKLTLVWKNLQVVVVVIIIIIIIITKTEWSKLSQKEYKNKHYWVGKVIHWELCTQSGFDDVDDCYKPKTFLKNENMKFSGTLKFKEITEWPDIVIRNKKKICQIHKRGRTRG